MENKIKSFWDWFTEIEEVLYYNIEMTPDDYAFLISEQLKVMHQDLAFEISFEVVDDKRNFVISADGDYELFPLVLHIVVEAPEFERWNVVPFRPRLHQKNQVIDLDGIKLDYDDVYFIYNMNDEYIDLDVYIKGYDQEDNRFVHTYFLLLDSLIGEYDAVTKIGLTTIHPFTDELQEQLQNIRELINIIDFLKTEEEEML